MPTDIKGLHPTLRNPIPMPKIQKPAGCKFCDFKNNDGHILLNDDTAEYSGMTVSVLSNGPQSGAILRVRSLTDDHMLVDSQDAININYCPMCGRKIAIGKGAVKIQ